MTVLFGQGLIHDAGDIYALAVDKLEELERVGEKSAGNLVAAIEASKQRPFAKVLFGLGIRHVGEQTAEVLAAELGDIDALIAADAEVLETVASVGPIIAQSVVVHFEQEGNRGVVEKLRATGVHDGCGEEAGKDPPALCRDEVRRYGNSEPVVAPGGGSAGQVAGGQHRQLGEQENQLFSCGREARLQAGEGGGARRHRARRRILRRIGGCCVLDAAS